MKSVLSLLIFCVFGTIGYSHYGVVNQTPEKVVKYDPTLENSLVLPTDFAGQFIVNEEQLKKLADHKIYHVELVYTQFKSSPSFDQVALNRQRVTQILKLIPQLKTDSPTWSLVEQTGATTRDVANTYFHGFVLHYAKGLDHHELGTFFSSYQNAPTTYTVNNAEGTTVKYKSGTSITLSPNSVTYSDGTPVTGSYELSYREFRNPAEIAFSGLPMNYTAQGVEYNFSSVGMYEITAKKDGKDLQLSQPAVIDFNCTKTDKGVSFYQMNQQGDWKKLKEVNFEDPQVAVKPEVFLDGFTVSSSRQGTQKVEGFELTMNYKVGETGTLLTMNNQAWTSYLKLKKENDSIFSSWVISENKTAFEVTVKNEHALKFNRVVMDRSMRKLDDAFIEKDANATLLAEGADAGHTYPTLVRGLNTPKFGVYNCDQIYRIGKVFSLAPLYVDESGKEIQNKHVACVLDLTYNGSFSFHPNRLLCNQEGRNFILLFTEDKRVYMLDDKGFASLDKSNTRPNLVMKDMTATLKSTEDLKKILGI